MAINDALSAVDVSTDIKDLTKLVKQFPVRDGEKPWTAREVKDIAETFEHRSITVRPNGYRVETSSRSMATS